MLDNPIVSGIGAVAVGLGILYYPPEELADMPTEGVGMMAVFIGFALIYMGMRRK